MDIVFVGAGRLATCLAKALKDSGHRITAVYSRTLASASALSRAVGGVPTCCIDDLPAEADAFIIAVKDSAIAQLLPRLCQGRAGQTFFHTSGSVPMSVFGPEGRHGVIYPLQTFSLDRPIDFSRVHIYIEAADQATLALARSIAASVSQHVEECSSESRRQLHLAAVFACNFANHCYALAAQVMERQGLDFGALLPLIDETAAKVHQLHPRQAQTGPAIRYDKNVIEAHLQLLSDQPLPRRVYELMSESIHQLSEEEHD